MDKQYILVSAEKFGYGPIITCLNVVKLLFQYKKEFQFDLVFIGSSIAKKQAKNQIILMILLNVKRMFMII